MPPPLPRSRANQVNTEQTAEKLAYASMVAAEEMADSRDWLADMLMALTTVASVRNGKAIGPDFRLRPGAHRMLQDGAAVDGSPLRMAAARPVAPGRTTTSSIQPADGG
jgi:hypothetical protein